MQFFEFELQLIDLASKFLGLLAKHHATQLGQQQCQPLDLLLVVAAGLLKGITLVAQCLHLGTKISHQRLQSVDVVG